MVDLIAFTAAQLQPCLTVSFILAYAQQVLVEKFNVLSFMQNILPTSASICRHTDIIHICPLLGESTEGPDMCGFTPRIDLGATNFQFNVQSVGVLDLGCLQARSLENFFAVNIATTS